MECFDPTCEVCAARDAAIMEAAERYVDESALEDYRREELDQKDAFLNEYYGGEDPQEWSRS